MIGNCSWRVRPVRAAHGLIVVALALSVLPACGTRKTPPQMGLQRIALDLAFKADPDASPPPPTVRFQDLPPLPTPIQPSVVFTPEGGLATLPPRRGLPPLRNACPDAAPDAAPAQPVSVAIAKPPLAGSYDVRNKGTLQIAGGVFNLSTPYPAVTSKEVLNVVDTTPPPNALGQQGTRTLTFDVREALGDSYTLTRYSVTPTALEMTYRETKVGATVAKFSPTPAITIVGLGTGEGASWNSAGTDLTSGTTGIVQGKILKRETVDVCGTLVDTYRVQSSERFVSLNGTSTYSSATKDTTNAPNNTGPGLPNFYNVATQLGGIFMSVETHTTTTVAPVTIDIDNVGTMMSIVPKA